METVVYEMKVPKEGKEVVDLLDGVLAHVVAKKGFAELADLVDELMVAVDGVGGISEELKSEHRDELAGYLVHKLMGTLLPAEKAE